MPNYKRVIPRTPDRSNIGVVRMYVNANGDIVVEYASGNVQVLPIDGGGGGGGGPVIIDGDFAPNTQTIVRDGGNAGTAGTTTIDAGGAFLTL